MVLIPVSEPMFLGMLAVLEKIASTTDLPVYQSKIITPWKTRLHGALDSASLCMALVTEIGLPLLVVIVRVCIIGQMFYGLHSIREVYTGAKWGRYMPYLSLI